MRAREIIYPAPKSVWTTSLHDLYMTPQEKALRAKATHNWLVTRKVLAQARARELLELLRSRQRKAPTQLVQQS
jgi:hypothetical protein